MNVVKSITYLTLLIFPCSTVDHVEIVLSASLKNEQGEVRQQAPVITAIAHSKCLKTCFTGQNILDFLILYYEDSNQL